MFWKEGGREKHLLNEKQKEVIKELTNNFCDVFLLLENDNNPQMIFKQSMNIFGLLYNKLAHLILIVEEGLESEHADALFGKELNNEEKHPVHYYTSIFLAKIMRNLLGGNLGGDYM